MQRRIRTLWVTALVVASCGGASKWEIACGCVPNSVAAGQELGITEYLDDGSIDPKLLVSKLDAYLLGRGAAVETIVAIRELGPFHDHACYEPMRETARCYYWLWDGGNGRRGIQVDIRGGCAGVEPRDCSISYKYVEERSDSDA
jgi:hypothetical protein